MSAEFKEMQISPSSLRSASLSIGFVVDDIKEDTYAPLKGAMPPEYGGVTYAHKMPIAGVLSHALRGLTDDMGGALENLIAQAEYASDGLKRMVDNRDLAEDANFAEVFKDLEKAFDWENGQP
ncbi:hypothetical protein [Nonomuraea cavernae]|uniref:Uncharacterized protein n=1 Tax=Nonomuraea cavernae TaxID=2045107 RepID=A0A918DJ92_9ACTN|nr:hypothetical protein [Nonomuraea cavernae]MCA2187279.1 hypothetical protein [Nonomuraea cavernae]GGO68128.1 hypothetical protein GCM10012289_26170 [Nonomuraea cavernae]